MSDKDFEERLGRLQGLIHPLTDDDLLRIAAKVPIPSASYPTPPCQICSEPIYFTVSGIWRHVETDYAHDPTV